MFAVIGLFPRRLRCRGIGPQQEVSPMATRRMIRALVLSAVLTGLAFSPAGAQEKAKKSFSITADLALETTKTVLVAEGFDVVKLESQEDLLVVYYRRGNMGKGKGKGPMEKMVIRRHRDVIVIEEVEPTILLKIEVALEL